MTIIAAAERAGEPTITAPVSISFTGAAC